MYVKTIDELHESHGRFVVLYGETGVGKTTSVLQSAPDPIIVLEGESRNLKLAVDSSSRPDLRGVFMKADNWDELMEFVQTPAEFCTKNVPNMPFTYADAKTILLDGVTHLMGVELLGEITQQAFDSRKKKEQDELVKSLTGQVKSSQESYGAMGAQMLRLFNALGRMSKDKMVIVTALIDEHPKWNRALAAAPAFAGNMFGRDFKGEVDYIGLVTHNNADGTRANSYPPMVRFEETPAVNGFLCKWSGIKPVNSRGNKVAVDLLDLRRIFGGGNHKGEVIEFDEPQDNYNEERKED